MIAKLLGAAGGSSLDTLRYFMALFVAVTLPVVLVFWLVIHAGIGLWRRVGPGLAYGTATVAMVLVILLLRPYLELLLGVDLGTQPLLVAVGGVIYLLSIVASAPVRRSLRFRTFIGWPELAGESHELLLEGPYRFVRHPRYLMVIVGIVGWALVCNYAGVYLLSAAAILGFLGVVELEENELEGRYGEEYEAYQARVPKLLPSAEGLKGWIAMLADPGRAKAVDEPPDD